MRPDTPGHSASGNEQLMISTTGYMPALLCRIRNGKAHTIRRSFGRRSRHKLIDKVIADKIAICGAHFPFTGSAHYQGRRWLRIHAGKSEGRTASQCGSPPPPSQRPHGVNDAPNKNGSRAIRVLAVFICAAAITTGITVAVTVDTMTSKDAPTSVRAKIKAKDYKAAG
jgi:hypothetical protein